jgi:hypothetical protein
LIKRMIWIRWATYLCLWSLKINRLIVIIWVCLYILVFYLLKGSRNKVSET